MAPGTGTSPKGDFFIIFHPIPDFDTTLILIYPPTLTLIRPDLDFDILIIFMIQLLVRS